MIIDILMIVGSALLAMLRIAFSPFHWVFPPEVITSISNAFSYLGYFNGVLPMQSIFAMMTALVGFYGVWYTYKLILFIWQATPFIGKDAKHPKK